MRGCFEILVYHRVGRENSLDGLTISKETFTKQMRHVRRQCRPMALKELVLSVFQEKAIPARAVAITFDDGYADTYKIAFPILKHYRIPATIFITTGFINKKAPSYQNAPMLSWGMIKKMQQEGVEIGAHTLTHPRLTRCSLREVKRQMIGSKCELEDQLKNPVSLFAYPYGGTRSFNQAIKNCAREAGFLAACTTLPGSNGQETDLYALHRLAPLRDQIHELVFQLDQASRKTNLRNGQQIQGISPKVVKLWTTRYQKVRRRLIQKSPFYWQMESSSSTKSNE